MKRFIAVLMVLLLFVTTAAASEIPQLSADMFLIAKRAMLHLADAEYEKLVTLLPFSDIAPSASEWQSFAEGNFTTLSDEVLNDCAVAYWSCGVWKLAIPACDPTEDYVETLVLSSTDGVTFSGYCYSTWLDVKNEYLSADYVMWGMDYLNSLPMSAFD